MSEAVNELIAQGGFGNVQFYVNPGTYTGQYSLVGLGENLNSLVIESMSGNPEDVVLTFDASTFDTNFILRVEDETNITIRNITFQPISNAYQRCILFRNNAHNLTIDGCVFIGSANSEISADGKRSLIHCDQEELQNTFNPDSISIVNNHFEHGSIAIDLKFDGFNAHAEGMTISGNTCMDQLYTGINVQQCSGEIHHNTISTDAGFFFAGIRCFRFDQGSQVYSNSIRIESTGGATGIEYSNNQDTFGNTIYNNMVYVNSEGDVRGIIVFNLWGTTIDHNTCVITGGIPEQSAAFHHISNFPDGEDTILRNNIFCSYNGSVALRAEVGENIAELQYCDLYSSGEFLASLSIVFFPTISDLIEGYGIGQNCVNIDPQFPALPDLHLTNCSLDDLGTPLAEITTDIDEETRDNSTPDMGADEFDYVDVPVVTNLSVVDTDLPLTLNITGSYASYDWSSGATTSSIEVLQSGVYTCVVTDDAGCTYTFVFNVEVTITHIETLLNDANLLLYPNPANDFLTWKTESNFDQLEIRSLQGHLITSQFVSGRNSMDISQLESGVYYLRLINNSNAAQEIFVKN
jgi:hypothetical protein